MSHISPDMFTFSRTHSSYRLTWPSVHRRSVLRPNSTQVIRARNLADARFHRHIRRLAESHDVPMPALDVALQHMLSARAHGGAELDWTALVGGQRIAAGLPPFSSKVSGRIERSEVRASTKCKAGPGEHDLARGLYLGWTLT